MPNQERIRTTPPSVHIRRAPRKPVSDPKLGVDVPAPDDGPTAHRLVTIGDSLTHGFMSGAIYRTDLSWPAIVAFELGLQAEEFTFPVYEWPAGPGGLPFDLERLARGFGDRFGDRLDFWEVFSALAWLRGYMDEIEDHWERGVGAHPPDDGRPFHNMAVYGWDLLDALVLDAEIVAGRIKTPEDDLLAQFVENHGSRAAWPVVQRARAGTDDATRTVFDAARHMGAENGGIEILVVALGANNALGSVLSLEPSWTPDDYLDSTLGDRLEKKREYNVWQPPHFAEEWARVVEELRQVNARHVILTTIPAVTIAPIARGVAGKVRPQSRYFPYYTRPWIADDDFDPERDPRLDESEARGIDSAIDAYNETIIDSVRAAREQGRDWYLFDMGGLLDRLAVRRYIQSPWTRPAWWTPYELPAALQQLEPLPNVRFFRADKSGRTDGGLISLDGVHPTTIGYGIVAQEVIKIMQLAGVTFRSRDGTERTGDVEVDFARLIASDTLLDDPPAVISNTLGLLGWLDERLDWANRILPFMPNPL